MRLVGSDLSYSATDLANFLGCRHRMALDKAVALGKRARPHRPDPLLELLAQRGKEHEQRFVALLADGSRIVRDLGGIEPVAARLLLTIEAMREGAHVIVQGALTDGPWFGYADVLRRVEVPSALGGWSYEVTDTKLSRETRAGAILQLGLYSEMLGSVQGRRPEYFHVVTPGDPVTEHAYRVDDYAAYFRLVQRQLLATVTLNEHAIAALYYPEPVEHCEICPWWQECDQRRRDDDHLSLVAGVARLHRRELESRDVTTLTGLAGLQVPLTFKPRRGAAETYANAREQARAQLASRGRTPPLHTLRPVVAGTGLCRLPQPSPGDVFLDLEGDPFAAEGGREYLFGLVRLGDDGAPAYHSWWAFDERAERAAFEQVMDLLMDVWSRHDGMHIYHFAPYEPSAFKRLMGRYATRAPALDRLLRGERFVDLLAVVRQAMWAGVESYSIKRLEPLYGFTREVRLADANQSLRVMERALEERRADLVPPEVRESVEGYNRDDCVSTLRLRDWLEMLRTQLEDRGTAVPRPAPAEDEASGKVDEREQRMAALRSRLLAGVPETASERTPEQHARWLVAHLLDYHRREDKAAWWEYFRLRDLTEEDLFDEPNAVAGLEFAERVDVVVNKRTKRPTGTVIDRYRYPPQEMEIEARAELRLQSDVTWGKVVRVDRVASTIDVRKGPGQAEYHARSAFEHTVVRAEAQEDALQRLGAALAATRDHEFSTNRGQTPITENRSLTPISPISGWSAAGELLLRHPPRLQAGSFAKGENEDAVPFAVRTVTHLDRAVLPIQGPPGSGKTYAGAQMIRALVRQGKKVGVTANSHRVILNLLERALADAHQARESLRIAHKVGDEDDDPLPPGIQTAATNAAALELLQSGRAQVLGGTAWLWAREEFAGAVDVLFVDEAGQMALANVLAVSQAAASVVLLGDPQQLEQPRKGAHPEGVGVSALHHILDGRKTIPEERGIFLPITWRLAPRICAFTSELYYEGKLRSRAGLERQVLMGTDGLDGSGLWVIGVAHDGNRNASAEESEVVADLVARLTRDGARWVNDRGEAMPLRGEDILIVAPYNAQVSRLAERLAGTGARVGTVDKFQGQEAPVVVYSMATSRPEDAPRGMEFLYSPNRLNVATSRARCASILVASPLLFQPECRSPRQMKLANGVCRYRELAQII